MTSPLNGQTRRVVAIVLGALGVAVLVDVLVLALVLEDPDLSSARKLLFIIIAALLIVAGVVSFDWKKLHTRHEDDEPAAP